MNVPCPRKHLSAEGLLSEAQRHFEKIPGKPGCDIALVDHLLAGLTVFGLKCPSLMQFDQDRREGTTPANLSLYGIERAPSDTRFAYRLDAVDPRRLRPLYKALLGALQRGKGLEGFAYLDGHYLLSLDGTGYFSSKKVHCAQCGEKHHRDGTITDEDHVRHHFRFEHNFGHGDQNLSTVLMHLMMLAFLIDQIQQRCCRLFQAALTAAKTKTRLWRKLRSRFDLWFIDGWEALYRSIFQPPRIVLTNDTA